MKKEIIVIIPVYLPEPVQQERYNLRNNIKKLSNYDICFVCPAGLQMDYYKLECPAAKIKRFNDSFFDGLQGYNNMMLSIEFYNSFLDYVYVCICQLDVLIIKSGNCLDEFIKQGYDYYGAPWFPAHRIYPFSNRLTIKARLNLFFVRKKVQVGNGGLSLRKIQSVLHLLKNNKRLLEKWKIYEDYFFSYMGKYIDKSFKIAPVAVAKSFALETNSREVIMKEKIIPVGLHAPQKWFPEIYDMIASESKI